MDMGFEHMNYNYTVDKIPTRYPQKKEFSRYTNSKTLYVTQNPDEGMTLQEWIDLLEFYYKTRMIAMSNME